MSMKDTLARVIDSTQQLFTDATEGKAEPAPDALVLLKRDHDEVKVLFEEVLADDADGVPKQRKTIERILKALELHAKIEEALLYPAIQQKTKRDTDDRHDVLEAIEEHGSMKDLMRKIKRTTGRDDTLRAKVQVLKEIVEHHVEEEESSLFSEARRLLGDKKLHAIGAEIVKIKARAARRDAPASKKTSRTSTSTATATAKRTPTTRKGAKKAAR